jgi:BolA protein
LKSKGEKMRISEEINSKLTKAFAPDVLVVLDESEKHRGHVGHRAEGESHFNITLRAKVFGPMSRIARHRAVHSALGAELVGRIHALAIDVAEE